MKIETTQIVIIILLVLCIGLLVKANIAPAKTSAPATGEAAQPAKGDAKMTESEDKSGHPTTIEIIMRRKSVRDYTDEKISKETLDTIVKAGMAAPSAANKQPWAFVVVTERETLDKLAEGLEYAKMLKKAPAAIVVCGVPKIGLPGKAADFWIQDCSAVSENILLAVESLDLGAVWTGVYPDEPRVKFVQKILGIPEDVIPLNVIAVGHPTGKEKPKDKYKPDRIHWGKW